MHLSRFSTMPTCERIFILRSPVPGHCLRHLTSQCSSSYALQQTHRGSTYGAVVVKAVCQMGIAADHMRRFRRDTGDRVMDTTTLLGNFQTGRLTIRSCAWYIMVIPAGTRWLTTARAVRAPLLLNTSIQSLSAIPRIFGIGFTQPDHRTTAT